MECAVAEFMASALDSVLRCPPGSIPAGVIRQLKQQQRQRERQKTATGLNWQNNNAERTSRFFAHFFCRRCTIRTQNCIVLHFVEDVNTQDNDFLIYFWISKIQSFRIQAQKKLANI